MNRNTICTFDTDLLARWLEGDLDEETGRGVEIHVAACPVCDRVVSGELHSVSGSQEEREVSAPVLASLREIPGNGGASPGPVQTGPQVRRSLQVWIAAAAALLLAAGVGAWFFPSWHSDDPAPQAWRLSESKHPVPPGEPLRTSAGETAHLEWSGGSRVSLLPESEARWTFFGKDGIRLEVRRGGVQVETAPGAGRWEVETPAGRVRVLGTVFSVRLIPVPLLEEGETSSLAAVVELRQGRVELESGGKRELLTEGHRGVMVSGWAPHPMALEPREVSAQETETAWRGLMRGVREKDGSAVSFYTAVMAVQGERAREVLAAVRTKEGPEGEWARKVSEVLGW